MSDERSDGRERSVSSAIGNHFGMPHSVTQSMLLHSSNTNNNDLIHNIAHDLSSDHMSIASASVNTPINTNRVSQTLSFDSRSHPHTRYEIRRSRTRTQTANDNTNPSSIDLTNINRSSSDF